MSAVARLNMNEIPYYSWKGKTLEQITSVLKKNTNTLNPNPKWSIYQLRKPMPLKIYRREIANIQHPSCYRNSCRIASFEQPGGSIITNINAGLVNVLDTQPPSFSNATTITSEHPGQCAYPSNCILSPEINAKKRVRSAGMIPKKYKLDNNNDKSYFTSTNEYLVSRNRTIQQNSYVYFKQGNSGVQPGTGNAKSNIYSPGGLNHCYQPMISVDNRNNFFTYRWLDNVQYKITIPDGQYNVDSLNDFFKKAMVINNHYFYDNNGVKYFLMTIDYDNVNRVVILEANPASKNLPFPASTYTPACGLNTPNTWYSSLPQGDVNVITDGSYNFTSIGVPLNNDFGKLIGFYPGDYYNGGNRSAFKATISPNFVPLHYKPSNVIFGIQGPVDSSTYTDRVRYNNITRNGYLTNSAYGTATANAMAYGVSEQPYTVKNVIGFPNTATPVFKNGNLCRNEKFIYRK